MIITLPVFINFYAWRFRLVTVVEGARGVVGLNFKGARERSAGYRFFPFEKGTCRRTRLRNERISRLHPRNRDPVQRILPMAVICLANLFSPLRRWLSLLPSRWVGDLVMAISVEGSEGWSWWRCRWRRVVTCPHRQYSITHTQTHAHAHAEKTIHTHSGQSCWWRRLQPSKHRWQQLSVGCAVY